MTRFRLVFAGLALLLAVVAARLVWTATHRDRENGSSASAARVAAHGVRVAAQVSMSNPGASGAAPSALAAPVAPAAPAYATAAERRFASAGASRAEIDAVKQAWPDWESRFASASDDMAKAHLERVKPFVPVAIPDEVSRVGASLGDDLGRAGAGGASVIDDLGRAGGGMIDDVARGGASVFDDLLRVLGLGGAAAGAAAAAASKRKK